MTETVTETPARNYVGGEWRESASGETYEKRNPWRPSQVTGVYPASDAGDAQTAIGAAHDAFPAWSAPWPPPCLPPPFLSPPSPPCESDCFLP